MVLINQKLEIHKNLKKLLKIFGMDFFLIFSFSEKGTKGAVRESFKI